MNSVNKFRAACFTFEGINSFAVTLYINYSYFYFRDRFGFNDRQNLALAALLGAVYIFSAFGAGKFAQRYGYFTALKIGFAVMAAGLALGSQAGSVMGTILATCAVNAGTCFIWPILEALVSKGGGTAHAIGIYNIIWAITNALAFFIGGTMIEKFGSRSLFFVPLVLMLAQLVMVFRLKSLVPAGLLSPDKSESGSHPERQDDDPASPALAKHFQRLAWLANPFAYIAINTLLAVLPGIAHKFDLSPMVAGFVCSLWCFVRVGAFVALSQWNGWHYRFRWLIIAYVLMVVSFTMILVAPALAVILAAQIFFGAAVGLIYYSSLFYAMDAHDSGSEQGGIHEAAIGIGNCLGPAAGAAALWLAPQNATAGAWAVSGLLTVGLGGLAWLRRRPANG